MKTFNLEFYGEAYSIGLKVSRYQYGNNLAIQMFSFEDGYAEPWSDLTVNLDSTLPLNCAYIDTNGNGEEILQWIKQYNLAVPTGRYGFSGFCKYPEYRFEAALLREIDPAGYEDYLLSQKQVSEQPMEKIEADQRKNEKMEQLLSSQNIMHGIVTTGSDSTEYWFEGTIENIASFLAQRPFVRQMILYDEAGKEILDTFGSFINRCSDKRFLEDLKKVLVPMQLGEKEPIEFFCPSVKEVSAYRSQKKMI